MTYKKFNLIAASIVVSAAIVIPNAIPVLVQAAHGASTSSATNTSSTSQAKLMARMIARADEEIARRIKVLNALSARIGAMKKISDSEKSSLTSTVQAQITELNNLKAKIDADTDLATLRADVQSIAKSYRIYRLVIPQTEIIAASDRIMTIADQMSTLGAKLQARISAAQASGTDVTAMQSAYADFTAKLSDAKSKAQAAIDEVASLTPDNGDQAKLQANMTALKDARAKVHAAREDLAAARKDASTIAKDLRKLNVHTSSSTSD